MNFMKSWLSYFHPQRFFKVLSDINQTPHSWGMSQGQAQRLATATLLLLTFSLVLIHQMKYFSSFHSCLGLVSLALNQDADWLLDYLTGIGFSELSGYIWWGGWHFVGYLLIPWGFIHFVLKKNLADFGWCRGELCFHWKWYFLLFSINLLGTILVSFRQDFISHYPFYHLADRSWMDLIVWEFVYLSQFVLLEFFFRGFILHGLKPAFGANAIFVMCVPYVMIHFSKPWLEVSTSILLGIILGVLAILSRSIWGGVIVHIGVALSMDLAALIHKGGLPQKWWPL